MNKKNILKILITIILITIFSVFVFKKDNQKIENDTRNQKQEKIVENKTTKIEKENKENKENKQKVLLKNIQFGNKKVDVIEDKNEKDEKDVDITKLIIRDKETGKNILLEKFEAFEFYPIEIIQTFVFKGIKGEYLVIVIIDKDENKEYHDIYLYNDKKEEIGGKIWGDILERTKKWPWNKEILTNKEKTLEKLNKFKKEGKL